MDTFDMDDLDTEMDDIISTGIVYEETRDFTPQELERLFLSVGWSSGHYPEKLAEAMKHFGSVFSAWDGDRLVGMVCAMDDGVMNAYVHYLLVEPEYQGKEIGRTLMKLLTDQYLYRGFLRIGVIGYNDKLGFYESCGFKKSEGSTPLFITDLWT